MCFDRKSGRRNADTTSGAAAKSRPGPERTPTRQAGSAERRAHRRRGRTATPNGRVPPGQGASQTRRLQKRDHGRGRHGAMMVGATAVRTGGRTQLALPRMTVHARRTSGAGKPTRRPRRRPRQPRHTAAALPREQASSKSGAAARRRAGRQRPRGRRPAGKEEDLTFIIKCKCGAVIPPGRLIGVRLDEIPKVCDDCAAASEAGRSGGSKETNTPGGC